MMAACAPNSGLAPAPSEIRIDTPGGIKQVQVGMAAPVAEPTDLDVAMGDAWTRLPAAFASLGLPGGTASESSRTLTVGPVVVARRLGGARLSTYLNCGNSLSHPNADTHSVHLTVVSQLVDTGGRTRVETRVHATATPRVTSGAAVACSSSGALERRIAQELQRVGA
jgi:hypothetical protein